MLLFISSLPFLELIPIGVPTIIQHTAFCKRSLIPLKEEKETLQGRTPLDSQISTVRVHITGAPRASLARASTNMGSRLWRKGTIVTRHAITSDHIYMCFQFSFATGVEYAIFCGQGS